MSVEGSEEEPIKILLVSPLLSRAREVFEYHGCQIEDNERGQLLVFPPGTTSEPLYFAGEAVLSLPDGWRARQMLAYDDKHYVFYFSESRTTTS